MTNAFEGPVEPLAESISQRLELLRGGSPLDVVLSGADPETAEHVALAVDLARILPQQPDPVFRAALQVRLQTAMNAPSRRTFGAVMATWVKRATPRLAGAILAVGLVAGSAAVAAAGSLPGDVLYPVKRASEEARALMIRDSAGRVHYRLAQADERLDEIQRLIERGVPITPEVVDALLALRQIALDESRSASTAVQKDVEDWSASRHDRLVAMAVRADSAASEILLSAAGVLVTRFEAPMPGSQQPGRGVAPIRLSSATPRGRAQATSSLSPTETPPAHASQGATATGAGRTPTPTATAAAAQVTSTFLPPATAVNTAMPQPPVELTPGPGDDSRIDPVRATALARQTRTVPNTPDAGSVQNPAPPTLPPPPAEPTSGG